MKEANSPIVMTMESDPVELAKAHAQLEAYARNWDWLEAHAKEVYSHRGKMICISGQELFVGDMVLEVLARAQAAHPDDLGPLTQYIPVERGPRIYANRW